MTQPTFIIVDLFCGAGGTTTGFAQAADGVAKVIACVNHDHKAIQSHWRNHPEVKHFEEDIRTLDLTGLVEVVDYYQCRFPDAKLILWASLECTNFSKAKGGQPREADSRTLADHLDRYVHALDPDYVQIENVVEFMSWGPLDGNGKPISRKNGTDWMKWRTRLCSYGYRDEWKELNSADFGAYTSRNRLFGVFAKDGLPIAWPLPTHSKTPHTHGLHLPLKKWKPVKDVLDFSDEGESIFTRKKPLAEKTLERIYAGLIKYVAGGKEAFMVKYNSMGKSGSYCAPDIDSPLAVIPTRNMHYLAFISKYFSGKPEGKNISVEGPAGTIKTVDGQALVQTKFLQQYYGNGTTVSTDNPAPTLTTKDRCALVSPEYFIDKQYGSGIYNTQSIEAPAGAVLPNPKMSLVSCRFLMNPQYFNNGGDINKPCFTLIARMDKAPPYLVTTDTGDIAIEVYNDDSDSTKRIKQFMADYGITDIKMRMLKVPELLRIQGFPNGYQLAGNQGDQKKFIGNSVVPQVVKAWCEAMAVRVSEPEVIAA